MESLAKILNKKKSYQKLLQTVTLQSLIKKNWSYIFGKCSEDIQFNSINGQTLIVDSCNYIWVSEISHFKTMIISRVNKLASQANIKYIKVLYLPRSKFSIETKGDDKEVPNMGLEEKIKANIQTKINMGMEKCIECQSVYTKESRCVFCRTSIEL